ncbi:unnamed protein product [Sphagnum balticum]
MNNPGGQKLILITNLVAETEAEINVHASEWRLPDSVDDVDITLVGKPLRTLVKEDRWVSLHGSQESSDVNFQETSIVIVVNIRRSSNLKAVKPLL